jgi:GNAT superfamily N-acetyltransferase
MRSAGKPDLRLAEPSELAQIAAFLLPLGGEFFGERFPDGTVEDFYRWKYFGNLLGNAIVGIATAGNSVVSVVAATPKRVWLLGKTVLAYELGDFLTDGNYRKMGLFSQLIELVCSQAAVRGASLVYVRPNDVSFPILTGKLSFHEVQRIDARKFLIPSHTLSRKTGIPASLLGRSGIDWFLKNLCIPKSSGSTVTVAAVERFEQAGEFWERTSTGYNFSLVRDSNYLNWRFCDGPTPYRRWLALRDGKMAGFLITSADRSGRTAAVVDLFTESGDKEAVRALLATGLSSLLASGAQLIRTWVLQGPAQSAAQEGLRRAFPFRRKNHLHLAFRVLRADEIPLPLPAQKWHFTLGDSDGA